VTPADKSKRLKGLYAITDEKLLNEKNFKEKIELALLGGTRIIQYRDKSSNQTKRLQQATQLCELCRRYKATSIINDDIELAHTVRADGVHLGKNDHSIEQARNLLGEHAIIGVSCYDDINLAIDAENNNADYVAFGAMFSSPTKPEARITHPEIISSAKNKTSLPVCAIGGITLENITQLVIHDVDMIAVISSLFSSEDIKLTAKNMSQKLS